MNSKDFELPDEGSIEDLSPMEIAILIWDKQHELIVKYQPVEGTPDFPLNIDNPEHQVWIKDYFWRITEELQEYKEAMLKEEYDHAVEELSDTLHFFTGLFILLGFNDRYPKLFKWALEPIKADDRNPADQIVFFLGLAGNCLKNKKWKQSPVRTNVPKFEFNLKWAFQSLFRLLAQMHLDKAPDIYKIYSGKHQINQERIKSNY